MLPTMTNLLFLTLGLGIGWAAGWFGKRRQIELQRSRASAIVRHPAGKLINLPPRPPYGDQRRRHRS